MASIVQQASGRAVLTRAMDACLDALAAHDPVRALLAEACRYTENGQSLAIGDGAWATIDAFGPYRHDFVDEARGEIAAITTITEGKTRSILILRLRVADGRTSEIEAMVARPDLMNPAGPFASGADKLDDSRAPDPNWFAPIPEGERMSREALRETANMYFAGLERNDGKGVYPFADDCIRIENGFQTTGLQDSAAPSMPGDSVSERDTPYTPDFRTLSARQQFETGFFAFVDRIRDRRFPIIDEAHGLVFALAFFDHSGTVRDYTLANGAPVTANVDRPFSWQITEAFRIEKGLITRIEAVMTACPYGMRPGWDDGA